MPSGGGRASGVPEPAGSESFVLAFSCADRPGITAAVTSSIYQLGGDIIDAQQFNDVAQVRFFSRIEFRLTGPALSEQQLIAGLDPVLTSVAATWTLRAGSRVKRVMVLVSRADHCLVDLLYRWRTGELPMDLRMIASNHPAASFDSVELQGVPFEQLPAGAAEREGRLRELVDGHAIDLVVLARYMQILSPQLSSHLAGRCINIHHSFLPGFKGARPYHQAHARGVKLIGATAHYVTDELDEGPIIAQDVQHVSHRDSPESLARKGRDIERRVLAAAVANHLADRVLLNGTSTVVFPD
jgi:formyltetrahydrofolate deformylase